MEWLIGVNLEALLAEAHDALQGLVLLLVVVRMLALERARRRNHRR